ncbi:O-methyltransferase [Paenibacillus sp. Z6-24]
MSDGYTDNEQRWSEVDHYVEQKLIPEDSIMKQVLLSNQQADLPPFDVSPLQGRFLQLLVRMSGARRILEIGTLGGYSTIWMARALPAGGRIVTLELNRHHADTAAANFELAGVTGQIELRQGDALKQLARLDEEDAEAFDFIFIDADKPNNPDYLKWALRFSRPGTVIFGDNVIREGEIINQQSSDPRIKGVRTFYDMLAGEPRITATALQTIGSKGYDGFMIGIVNDGKCSVQ